MIASYLHSLHRHLLSEHLRLEERTDSFILHRDTWVTRHARSIEGTLLALAGLLSATVIGLWALPGAVWLGPAMVLKAAFSAALLWAASLLARAGRQGFRIETRIDRRAGHLEIVQSAFRGPPQVIGRIPMHRIESFYILRVRAHGAASHFYARLSDGRDAIYLGSDSETALEWLHTRLSGASMHSTEAMLKTLVGRAKMREAGVFSR